MNKIITPISKIITIFDQFLIFYKKEKIIFLPMITLIFASLVQMPRGSFRDQANLAGCLVVF